MISFSFSLFCESEVKMELIKSPSELSIINQDISTREMTANDKTAPEFIEWENHYLKAIEAKNPDIDIYGFMYLHFVFKGDKKVGVLYLRPIGGTLYFVFYSLEQFTKKGLGLGEKVIWIVDRAAKENRYKKIGVLTSKACGVYPYYEKRGFKKIIEDKSGFIWMVKEVID